MSSPDNLSLDQLAQQWESEGFVVLPEEKKKYNGHADKASVAEVESALSFIPPDLSNDEWAVVGMSIKDEFGDEGFASWDNWSSKGQKYKKREMRTRWNSFGKREGVTIGTLFFMAQNYGWSRIFVEQPEIPDFELNGRMTGVKKTMQPWAKPKEAPPKPKTDQIAFPKELFDAPGLPGEIFKFINKTSLVKQEILALGASISAAGSIMGRKVCGHKNIRSNFYIIGIAPSGSGKNHPRSAIKKLFHETLLTDLELGVPASSAGLVNSLHRASECRGLILWDELGLALKQFTGFKAGNHERDIMRALTELFTDAGSVYLAKSYANHDGKNPTKSLVQPCLSIYGTSVPSRFYEALSSGEATDGFLGRWLIFESKNYVLEEENQEEHFGNIDQSLLNICRFWKEQRFDAGSTIEGNLSDANIVEPRFVQATPPAKKQLAEFAREMRQKGMDMEKTGDTTGSIWARAGEHAYRLSLVAHENMEIGIRASDWGIKLASYCCNYMAAAINDYVSSSELESQTKRILRYIKERTKEADSWITRAEITRSFQGIQQRTRNEILMALCERGDISEERCNVDKGRPTSKFKAS